MIFVAAYALLVAGHSPVTRPVAEIRLLTRRRLDQAFPQIRPECLYAVLDQETPTYFQFSVRFDQEKCGGNFASDLLDRFVVSKTSGVIKHYEVAGCFIDSYSQWLKRQKKPTSERLTSRSTRTPPALPFALSQHSAISAPLVASVQAGPVSFFR
ncbi:hypothetical protein [Geothrix sp.]|jgi:hypothetical protein|uniref:hypothetical protein n=1 Tax=Geothrix sp. TaxID=1962974 RepID=UPI0025BF9EC9|nr:hypothetical protein [Geothrix sp.]